jgi:hypothetical protein
MEEGEKEMNATPITLTCPICQQPMTMRKQDESYNTNQVKHYDRRFFVCRTDDVWLRVETPQHITVE